MAFGDAKVSNMVAVGAVGPDRARLWFRAERPDRYTVEVKRPGGAAHGVAEVEVRAGNATDNTVAFDYPQAAAPPLAPLTAYEFRVRSKDGSVFVGAGQFETAPASADQTPAAFNVGILSCHQPFGEDGLVSDRNMRLLEQLPQVFAQHDIKLLLGVGDQIYADSPGEFSLMNAHYLKSRWPDRGDLGSWEPAQIRQAYQERYRICWNQVPWLKLLASYPSHAILDDHEVFDDWGSDPNRATPPYRKVIEAARQAYMDYQGSRQLAWDASAAAGTGAGAAGPVAPALDYTFRYGTLAGFTFDLRSEREVGPPARVLSAAQIARFKAFLAANRAAQVLLVVASVPLVHIPEWLTAAGQHLFGTKVDFADHWSAPQNRADRNAVLAAIEEHLTAAPKQRLIMVGGDVHVGCAFVVKFVGGAKPLFYEITTSAVTNRVKDFDADAGVLGPQTFYLTPRMADGKLDVSLLRAAQGAPARNPIGGLNAAIVECKRNGAETNIRLKLIGYGKDLVARPEFVSGWL